MNRFKKYYPILMIGFISFIISFSLHALGSFSLLETRLYDLRFKLRGPIERVNQNGEKIEKDVVLVAIDQSSYNKLSGEDVSIEDQSHPYPYPRGKIWTKVIENLTLAGASVIVFDIQFDAEDHFTSYKNYYCDENCDNSYDGNKLFRESIKHAIENNVSIVLGAKSDQKCEEGGGCYYYFSLPDSNILQGDNIAKVGLTDHEVDYIDAVSRRYAIYNKIYDWKSPDDGNWYYSLGVQAALGFLSKEEALKNKEFSKHLTEDYKTKIGALDIDTYTKKGATFLVNYYGPATNSKTITFKTYPLYQILDDGDFFKSETSKFMQHQIGFDLNLYNSIENPIARESYKKLTQNNNSLFKNKVVIIGSSLVEDHDYFETPFFGYENSLKMPGLEFHANAIQQMIDNSYINIPTNTLNLTKESYLSHIFILLFFIALTLFISNKSSIINSFVLTFLVLFIWFSVSMGLFINDQLWVFKTLFKLPVNQSNIYNTFIMVPVFFPMSSIVITYILNLGYRLFLEQKDKRFLKDTFGRYVAPKLIDDMYKNKKLPELGGESGIRTAFFSDIESFSKISSRLSPTELVELLNEFLSDQTDIILKHNGTLDKYEGDAILAFYGAPVFFDNHAEMALSSGVELFENLEKLKLKWRKEGDKWPNIVHNMNMRIGINTGEMVTGNMGSKQHMNYTMMGEVVNLAARLESGAKQYGIYYVSTHNTLLQAGIDKYEWRYIDRAYFMGFDKWHQIVEIMGFKDKISNDEKLLIKYFHKGLDLFYKQEWDEAEKMFLKSKKLETIKHSDLVNPSIIFLDRIKDFKISKPQKDWDGSFYLDEK